MEREAWLATLAYWLECGITIRSGERLQFSATPISTIGRVVQTRLHSATRPPQPQPSQSIQPQSRALQPTIAKTVAAQDRTAGSLDTARSAHLARPARPAHAMSPPPSAPERPSAPRTVPPAIPTVSPTDKPAYLADMTREVASCTRCALAQTRTKTVPGVGTPDAPVVFVGEGPGADEDQQGEPFVGAAGRLLDNMLRAVAWHRSDVFIANVVKCRPPGNRNPNAEEVSACQDYLFRQLEAIRPKAIFCLGKVALFCLTDHTGTMGLARGRLFFWRGIPVIASYHPAYYLRSPTRKRAAWEDLLRLTTLLKKHNADSPVILESGGE